MLLCTFNMRLVIHYRPNLSATSFDADSQLIALLQAVSSALYLRGNLLSLLFFIFHFMDVVFILIYSQKSDE